LRKLYGVCRQFVDEKEPVTSELEECAIAKCEDSTVLKADRRYSAESKDSAPEENVENPRMSRKVATS